MKAYVVCEIEMCMRDRKMKIVLEKVVRGDWVRLGLFGEEIEFRDDDANLIPVF